VNVESIPTVIPIKLSSVSSQNRFIYGLFPLRTLKGVGWTTYSSYSSPIGFLGGGNYSKFPLGGLNLIFFHKRVYLFQCSRCIWKERLLPNLFSTLKIYLKSALGFKPCSHKIIDL